jgi:hypothetical protein
MFYKISCFNLFLNTFPCPALPCRFSAEHLHGQAGGHKIKTFCICLTGFLKNKLQKDLILINWRIMNGLKKSMRQCHKKQIREYPDQKVSN